MKNVMFVWGLVACFFTSYGQQTGTFIDTRDGKVYKTVKVGNQTWFAENLAFNADSGCWAYADSEKYVKTYGYLYTYKTAVKVCPLGWRLPTDADWKELFNYSGGDSVAGAKLKSKLLWKKPNKGAIDSIGFSALPGGYRYLGDTLIVRESQTCGTRVSQHKTYNQIGQAGIWWSSSKDKYGIHSIIGMSFSGNKAVFRQSTGNGLSVRYIKK